jgi:hypothetical protein
MLLKSRGFFWRASVFGILPHDDLNGYHQRALLPWASASSSETA